VRWIHPERGMVPPGDFIPVAESTGLIGPIGGWVLHQACRQISTWRATEPGLGSMRVAVNVSMRQFTDDGFVALVADALRDASLDPAALSLEVTESVLLDDVEHAIRTLLSLRSLGVHLAIDDFGTGYSSLAYLRRFPVDVLKVDRSFVESLGTEPEESAILAAIVQLGAALGVKVVAEGIETGAQLAEVHRLGVAACQGYYFAKPKRADECLEWLRARLVPALVAAASG